MNKSLEYGRADVEWRIPAVVIATIWLGFFYSADSQIAQDILNYVRAYAFGEMAYAGFWIAGRAEYKKYINPSMDLIGGGLLMGVGGLMGVAMSLFNQLPDGKSHPEAVFSPIILLGAWWLVAIYFVLRRQAITQQENERG